MPGKIKVKVLAGRNLPVMDRASDTTDAFVEIKFGGVTHKTDVCRKSLNPHWSSTEWYRFEVDESELQDEPLQLRLMDHDTYSANDAIGKVVISLAPLLARVPSTKGGVAAPHGGAMMSGWIPVFDTMHGIRGELNVIVKVELFSDFNKYKTSSCGVQFFHCPMIPPGYKVTAIHGFVEELVVNDDPEYQWIDKIRTPRASNEARQVAFIKLSNQVQRLVGLKAAELGANAVIGYQQDFDLEGEAGVVARAIGTAVSITASPTSTQPPSVPPCSQQQLNTYLDILATDNESTTDLNEYFQTHQDELQKLLYILNPKTSSMLDESENMEEDDKNFELSRQTSIKSYSGNYSIYQNDYGPHDSMRHLSEDQTDLNRLLNRSDDDNESLGPLRKIKQLKTSILRLGSMKSRKSDQADDTVSIKSNVSDTSRISLSDIKNEFKKLKRLKKPKLRKAFANKSDEGIGMASVLARSVIHAHTSLACIAETQDSEPSPCSTLRRTSESEPTITVSDEEKDKKDSESYDTKSTGSEKKKLPTIKFSSLKDISTEEETEESEAPHRKLSESCPSTPMAPRKNFLKLPGEDGYFGSISSALSGDSSEPYSSSEEDDESSIKTDTENSYETTSSVVKSVLNNDVDPTFIPHMGKKLSVLECYTPDLPDDKKTDEKHMGEKASPQEIPKDAAHEVRHSNDSKTEVQPPELNLLEATISDGKLDNTFVEPKSHNLHFKFQNPFTHKKLSQSISAPSSPVEKKGFVYRSSYKIKRQLSKISKSSMIKSLSHYSLLPKRKHSDPKPAFSQHSSASDVPSKAPSETVLGSAFLSYSDLLTLDKESIHANNRLHKSDELAHSKFSMYIGSEPVSRASVSGPSSPNHGKEDYHPLEHRSFKKRPSINPSGLIATAMETILIDKVQNLLVPTSPNPAQQDEKKFFDDVNEKLEKVEEARIRKESENEQQKAHTTSKNDEVQIVKDVKEKSSEIVLEGNIGHVGDLAPEQQKISTNEDQTKQSKTENVESGDTNHKKLVRQDSIRSNESRKMSNEIELNIVSSVPHAPMLQHFHPLLSGAHKLETIPSLPETSIDQTESIDIDGTCLCNDKCECSDTNKASVCDNSHAACGVDRERERDRDKEKEKEKDKGSPRHARHESYGNREGIGSAHAQHAPNSSLEAASTPLGIHRRSSDSDLSVTPKGGSLNASVSNTGSGGGAILRPSMNSNNLEMLEYPFLTMSEYPPGFIVHIGGTVCARSVKLMDSGGESSSRAAWWAELRTELRAHARALRCNAVIAYTETAAICEDVCVLSASGTAAVIDLDCGWDGAEQDSCSLAHVPYSPGAGPYRAELSVCQGCRYCSEDVGVLSASGTAAVIDLECGWDGAEQDSCSLAHVPYSPGGGPYRAELSVCQGCRYCSEDVGVLSASGTAAVIDLDCGWDGAEQDSCSLAHVPYSPGAGPYRAELSVCQGCRYCSEDVGVLSASGTAAVIDLECGWDGAEQDSCSLAHVPYSPGGGPYRAELSVCQGCRYCSEDVGVLSASGTAAVIDLDCGWDGAEQDSCSLAHVPYSPGAGPYRAELSVCQGCRYCSEDVGVLSASGTAAVIDLECGWDGAEQDSCSLAHVPYSPGGGPYRAELSVCQGCRRARVPAVLLATCAKPASLAAYSAAVPLTAVAARARRAPPQAEPGARDISDQLPFLEYELHKLLLAKLRMQGANALFSLQTQVAVGERCVMAIASGIAVRACALPPPLPPRIKATENDKEALEIQKALWDAFTANKAANGYDAILPELSTNGALAEADGERGDEPPALDLCADKDACVLELDEAEDVETAKVLAKRRPLMQVFTSSSKALPGVPPHAFAQVWRARLTLSGQGGASTAGERHVARALDGVAYKLRRLRPCALLAPRIQLELPEDEIQLVVSGAAIRLVDPSKVEHSENGHPVHSADDDDIFSLDEEQAKPQEEEKPAVVVNGQLPPTVSLTSLCYCSGAGSVRRVCALRLLFVRETTAVRELGGLSGFLHTFTCEVLAIARAYTAALGGNALTSFYITQLMLQDNAHKNQGQCLLSVGGDVVYMTY